MEWESASWGSPIYSQTTATQGKDDGVICNWVMAHYPIGRNVHSDKLCWEPSSTPAENMELALPALPKIIPQYDPKGYSNGDEILGYFDNSKL